MRLSDIIYRAQGLSLKWKLLIPFLGFAFVGTVTLVYIGHSSQVRLIKTQEKKEILNAYGIFLAEIEQKETQALSIAATLAQDDTIQRLLAMRNREALLKAVAPAYRRLKRGCGVQILHFHTPPAKSFLRVHAPAEYGELIAYRKSVSDALKRGEGIKALEWGMSGVALRGVVPVYYRGKLVGGVEVGLPFGRRFLQELKATWGPDLLVYEKKGPATFQLLASTLVGEPAWLMPELLEVAGSGESKILISPPKAPRSSILVGPIKDYHGEVIGVVEIHIDRSQILSQISKTNRLMLLAGGIGIGLSFLLTWFVASMFVRPIEEIVEQAGQIAAGTRESRLEPRPPDEMGTLTQSLNLMLDALKDRQKEIEEYARTLELKVQERTADLVASEEKYRTLVEHLPLIVYRVLRDGTPEFVNSYFTEKLGYDPEEVVGNPKFWREKICGTKEENDLDILKACWEERTEFRTERIIKDKEGKEFIFLDRAIPMWGEDREIKWIDGIMVDITEQKRLQERALRAEEIRIVSEISARFAHELRNPLTVVGGFARRLRESFPSNDPRKKNADIIVNEIVRLEQITKIMLSSIKPLPLCLGDVDLACVVGYCLEDLAEVAEAKDIKVELRLPRELPTLLADEDLIARAFGILLEHSLAVVPAREVLSITIRREGEEILTTLRHKTKGITQDDLDQFFLPRTISPAKTPFLNLPLANIIFHRHGGNISVRMEERDILVVSVRLPLVALSS